MRTYDSVSRSRDLRSSDYARTRQYRQHDQRPVVTFSALDNDRYSVDDRDQSLRINRHNDLVYRRSYDTRGSQMRADVVTDEGLPRRSRYRLSDERRSVVMPYNV